MTLNDQAKDVAMEARSLHVRWTSIHVHSIASSIDISGAGMRGKKSSMSLLGTTLRGLAGQTT
ncbi:MAG: hypothetical protein ACKPKO_44735, partial [Candidatus Fonsibacter sp.]